MTTKRNTHISNQKEPIPQGYYTIRSSIRFLQSFQWAISYDGLSYYRKMRIIEDPVRFKGHMDKFYFLPSLWMHITTAKLLTNLWHLRLEDLSYYILRLPRQTYLALPNILLKVHQKCFGLEPKLNPGEQYPMYCNGTLYDTLCLSMKKILKMVIKNLKSDVSPEEFSDLLEKETNNYIKRPKTILGDPYVEL